MSKSEDSESGNGQGSVSSMAVGSSKESTPRKVAVQDQASLRTTPVIEWSIQQVAAFLQSQGLDDAIVQQAAGEMISGVELLELQNDDLRELGIIKMGPRKKLLTSIAKLKSRGAGALDESSTTQADLTSNEDESSSDAGHVKVTALFKKKKVVINVGEHITLENLLLQLSSGFGCRVKVKLEDEDGDQIAITNDQELADALNGEEEVTLQALKDLKWRAATGKKGSVVASSSKSGGVSDVVSEFAQKYVMFDELLDPYIVIDSEGTVLAFNPSAEKLLGYAKKKVIGKNVKMLMPDTYAKKHDTYLAKYARTGIKNVVDSKRTVMAKTSGGDMIPVELGVTEKEVGDTSHFVGCLRTTTGTNDDDESGPASGSNATGDVKIDKNMRKNMMSLQEAAIIITAEGRICLFNKAAENMFGHTASAVVGGPIEVLMGSPHKCNHAYYLQRYVATGEARVMNSSRNVQAKHKAGHWLDINLALSESESEDGEQIFIGLITANKSIAHKTGGASSALKAGSLLQLTRQMLSSMTVPGIIINENGIIQTFNREAEKLLGYSLIDVVGRNVSILMNDEDSAKHDGYLARYMATRQSTIIGAGKGRTVAAKHKSGKLFNMHLSIVEQEDEAGKKLFTGMLHKTKADLAEAKAKRKGKSKKKKEAEDDSE